MYVVAKEIKLLNFQNNKNKSEFVPRSRDRPRLELD